MQPDEALQPLLDQRGVWSFRIQGEVVSAVVQVIDARQLRERVDLLIETNAGSRIWVPKQTVRILHLAPDLDSFSE